MWEEQKERYIYPTGSDVVLEEFAFSEKSYPLTYLFNAWKSEVDGELAETPLLE